MCVISLRQTQVNACFLSSASSPDRLCVGMWFSGIYSNLCASLARFIHFYFWHFSLCAPIERTQFHFFLFFLFIFSNTYRRRFEIYRCQWSDAKSIHKFLLWNRECIIGSASHITQNSHIFYILHTCTHISNISHARWMDTYVGTHNSHAPHTK